MDGRTDRGMEGGRDGQSYGWIDGETDGLTDGLTDRPSREEVLVVAAKCFDLEHESGTFSFPCFNSLLPPSSLPGWQ